MPFTHGYYIIFSGEHSGAACFAAAMSLYTISSATFSAYFVRRITAAASESIWGPIQYLFDFEESLKDKNKPDSNLVLGSSNLNEP